jgi:hypothetical protein
MDADFSALQRFSDVPYVIESTASSSPLATAAQMNAAMGFDLRIDDSRGVTPEHYHRIVENIRGQLAADPVSRKEGYRIEIFDRAVPKPMDEAKKIDRTLRGFARSFGALADTGPNANAYRTSPTTASCIVVGWKPGDSASAVMGRPVGVPHADTGGMDAEHFQQIGLYHEIGHCLLGNSEAKADTFAALMMLRHTNLPVEALRSLASFRELSELTTPDANDDHFIAASLWRVVEIGDRLRASERFMSMDIGEVAAVAESIGDRFATMPDEIRSIRSFRAAFNQAAQAKVHYVAEPGGLRPTDFEGWLVANARIPEIERIIDLSRRLSGAGGTVERAKFDPQRVRTALAALSDRGDPTAKSLLRHMGRRMRPIDSPPEYMIGDSVRLPFRYGRSALSDDLIGFDAGTQTVSFDAAQQTYEVRDRFSGVPVRTGAVVLQPSEFPSIERASANGDAPVEAETHAPRP